MDVQETSTQMELAVPDEFATINQEFVAGRF
jgi:hypothetical protein